MQSERGSCVTRRVEPDAMETVFGGYVTLDVAETGRKAAFELVGAGTLRFWTLDLSGIAGFDAAVRTAGFAWMKDFRARGGKRMYIVAHQAMVRMMGSALAFATGMPVAFVPTREHAAKRIADER